MLSASQSRIITDAGFRPVEILSWNDLIAQVRYVFESAGVLYQLVPDYSPSWDVYTMSGTSGGLYRLSGLRRSEMDKGLPAAQFCNSFFIQYPSKTVINGGPARYLFSGALTLTSFVRDLDGAMPISEEVQQAVNKRHPPNPVAAKSVIEDRIRAEWESYKKKEFYEKAFASAVELEVQAAKDPQESYGLLEKAKELRAQIQRDLDSGKLKYSTPVPGGDFSAMADLDKLQKEYAAQLASVSRIPERQLRTANQFQYDPLPVRRNPSRQVPEPKVTLPKFEETAPAGRRRIILEDSED